MIGRRAVFTALIVAAPRVALATGRHTSVPVPAQLDGLFFGRGALIEEHSVAAIAH